MAILIVGEKPPRDLVLLIQRGRPHSKYYDLLCSCSRRRRRKDGTCKVLDLAMQQVRPEARPRIRPGHFADTPTRESQ